jgi:hypothetical protein
MPFQYACFISYAHDDGDLVTEFIEHLRKKLLDELGAYFDADEKLFIDRDSIDVGDAWEARIAGAMCRSACWMMVYMPKYRRKEYCRREYRAMVELEGGRRTMLKHRLPADRGMIIPVLLRSVPEDLPPAARKYQAIGDLRSYKVGHAPNAKIDDTLMKLAKQIYELWQLGEEVEELTDRCAVYPLPQDDPNDWPPERGGPARGMPRS